MQGKNFRKKTMSAVCCYFMLLYAHSNVVLKREVAGPEGIVLTTAWENKLNS